jgi:hypothetical protein
MLFESQISFTVRKLLCRNGLFLNVIEELQIFRFLEWNQFDYYTIE